MVKEKNTHRLCFLKLVNPTPIALTSERRVWSPHHENGLTRDSARDLSTLWRNSLHSSSLGVSLAPPSSSSPRPTPPDALSTRSGQCPSAPAPAALAHPGRRPQRASRPPRLGGPRSVPASMPRGLTGCGTALCSLGPLSVRSLAPLSSPDLRVLTPRVGYDGLHHHLLHFLALATVRHGGS